MYIECQNERTELKKEERGEGMHFACLNKHIVAIRL